MGLFWGRGLAGDGTCIKGRERFRFWSHERKGKSWLEYYAQRNGKGNLGRTSDGSFLEGFGSLRGKYF